jgi:pSer/pThr/pTyr-binding forkhead associated (FHA) protein
MRLSFANGEHADFVVDGGTISLGNAEGNTLVLPARDVAPWHARLCVDSRGIVLEVLDAGARTHVNARPVREKALLRCGDLLCLGRILIALKSDRDDVIATAIPADSPPATPNPQPARVILRGVAGSHFGKAVPIGQRLLVGSAAECGLVIDGERVGARHATIETMDDAIWLRDIDSPDGSLVNGVRVRDAMIHAGDQLAFERNYFVVEAPGLPPRGENPADAARAITQSHEALPATGNGPDAATAQGAIWWLIGVAALIALGLVVLIHRGF